MTSLSYRDAGEFAQRSLASLGMPRIEAEAVAEIFLRAQWRQQGHHDLSYLPQRLAWLDSGLVDASAAPEMVHEQGALAVFDAKNCLGELACSTILDHAIEKSRINGISLVSVRNSNHYLAGAPYAEKAAEAGVLSLIFSSTDKTMAAADGGRPLIGNNPLSAGVMLDGRPFILDMCMAYSSLGTLKKHLDLGLELPNYAGYDSEGRPSADPGAILDGGSLAPLGGHKGWGLALLVEILTGGLNGGAMGLEIPGGGGIGGHSQTVIAIDLGSMPSAGDLAARFLRMMDGMSDIDRGIRYPGSRRPPWTEANLDEDCGLSKDSLRDFAEWSSRLELADFV